MAATLASELRREQAAIAEQATSEMLAVFGALNFKAVDMSAPGFIEAAVSVAERSHAQAHSLGSDMYLSMRREAGVAGRFDYYRPELDVAELRGALIVLGPIAAKNLMSSGVRIPDAAQRVFTLTAGRVSKTALGGVRDTISGTAVTDPQAVAYARQVGSDPCDFCLLMAENTYKDAYSAMYSAGNRKRNQNPQPMGSKFHDHCQCTVISIFRGQLAGVGNKQQFMASWVQASQQGAGFDSFVESYLAA